MKVSIGADHAGFLLKERLKSKLIALGHEVTDHGAMSTESCDYPVFAEAVGRDVAGGASERGVLVCGTGVGMAIAANKISGIRAAQGSSPEQVKITREHNDANVLTLGARTVNPADADRMIDAFLETPFAGGRHARRVEMIAEMERND